MYEVGQTLFRFDSETDEVIKGYIMEETLWSKIVDLSPITFIICLIAVGTLRYLRGDRKWGDWSG